MIIVLSIENEFHCDLRANERAPRGGERSFPLWIFCRVMTTFRCSPSSPQFNCSFSGQFSLNEVYGENWRRGRDSTSSPTVNSYFDTTFDTSVAPHRTVHSTLPIHLFQGLSPDFPGWSVRNVLGLPLYHLNRRSPRHLLGIWVSSS